MLKFFTMFVLLGFIVVFLFHAKWLAAGICLVLAALVA